jgi:hypothetical protein
MDGREIHFRPICESVQSRESFRKATREVSGSTEPKNHSLSLVDNVVGTSLKRISDWAAVLLQVAFSEPS